MTEERAIQGTAPWVAFAGASALAPRWANAIGGLRCMPTITSNTTCNTAYIPRFRCFVGVERLADAPRTIHRFAVSPPAFTSQMAAMIR